MIAKSTLATLLVLAYWPGPALHAESAPRQSRHDARIKEVAYNASDVVRVIGHYGYSTDIEFATDEEIKSIALGDTLAWEVAPAGNHLFAKPREDNATTNMTVITNRRVYQIALDARRTAGSGPKSSSMYFLLRYTYPQDEAAKAKAALDQRIADARTRQVESAFRQLPQVRNWNYHGCGSKLLWPAEVFDDGRFTWLRFPAAQQIPAVFEIGSDGAESIVDGAMEGDFYVVRHTARRLVLRQGKAVACLENRSYNRFGMATPTGTRSHDVERDVRPVKRDGSVTTQLAPRPSLAPDPDVGALAAPVPAAPLIVPIAVPTLPQAPAATPTRAPSTGVRR